LNGSPRGKSTGTETKRSGMRYGNDSPANGPLQGPTARCFSARIWITRSGDYPQWRRRGACQRSMRCGSTRRPAV
jgi:hypothetical protein